jgi:hypothetical protein
MLCDSHCSYFLITIGTLRSLLLQQPLSMTGTTSPEASGLGMHMSCAAAVAVAAALGSTLGLDDHHST